MLRPKRIGQQAKDLTVERRFPMDTDLLTDVSTAKSSMIALTKGAIERKIIEEAPTKNNWQGQVRNEVESDGKVSVLVVPKIIKSAQCQALK